MTLTNTHTHLSHKKKCDKHPKPHTVNPTQKTQKPSDINISHTRKKRKWSTFVVPAAGDSIFSFSWWWW
jgi:hypothetical protein